MDSDDFNHMDMPCPSKCKNCGGTGKISLDKGDTEQDCPHCMGEGTIWSWTPLPEER